MEQLTADDPSHIARHRLLGRLGEGGMGRVYLGRSESGRTVAVKVIQDAYAQDPEFRRRFAREVLAARRVGGEWTAAVLDADTEATVPWVATQYVPGPDLHTVVTQDFGPLPEHSVRTLANRLALALQAVHGAGLIHRDLKPSNVLITIDGPRVIDFGIARALDGLGEDSVLTRSGAVIGSPGFMSPEQVRGQELTPASDVFCLGSVLAYAATGRPPFGSAGSGLHAQMFRVAEEEPDLDGVPDTLIDLVHACLLKSPQSRPTPQQVAAATSGFGSGPWLPSEVLAQLGSRAARLLDLDPAPQAQPPTPAHRTPTVYDARPASPPAHALPTQPAPIPPRPPMTPSPKPAPTGKRRDRTALAGVLALALIAIGAGLLALEPWRDGDGGKGGSGKPATDALPSVLGVWTGAVKGGDANGIRYARFRFTGDESGVQGWYMFVDRYLLCRGSVLSMRLRGTSTVRGDSLVSDHERADESVVARCRPPEPQTFTLQANELHWKSGTMSAVLRRTQEKRPSADFRAAFVGGWTSEGSSPAFHLSIHDENLEVLKSVLLYSGDIMFPEKNCTVRSEIAAIGDDYLNVAPAAGDVDDEAPCADFPTYTIRSAGEDILEVKPEGRPLMRFHREQS